MTVDLLEGDAEAIPFPAGSFDAVMSVYGAMFAPNHDKAAASSRASAAPAAGSASRPGRPTGHWRDAQGRHHARAAAAGRRLAAPLGLRAVPAQLEHTPSAGRVFVCQRPRQYRRRIDAELLNLRNRTYAAFVALGRAPAARELGDERLVRDGWRDLHEAHALVLNPATDEIRMANPFSAVPTAYRVQANGRWWYANCAWDAFGILSAFDVDGCIESSCPDCGEPYAVHVTDREIDDSDLLFHCLVPARHWWDDIVFT